MKILIWLMVGTVFLFSPVEAGPKPTRVPSGIYGKSLILPPLHTQGALYPATDQEIIVRRARDDRFMKRVRTNRRGNFKITLKPGVYIVHLRTPLEVNQNKVDRNDQKIVVMPNYYAEVWFTLQ